MTATPKTDYIAGDKINASEINDIAKHTVPTAVVLPYVLDTAPDEWPLCDGTAVSRTTFATLFAAIGPTFGVGDGSTTFNVPDMRGRLPLGQDDMGGTPADRVTDSQADALAGSLGAEEHTLTIAQMPGHTHGTGEPIDFSAGTTEGDARRTIGSGTVTDGTGGDQPHNNLQPSLTVNYIIKT